jgi:hypothetical protein
MKILFLAQTTKKKYSEMNFSLNFLCVLLKNYFLLPVEKDAALKFASSPSRRARKLVNAEHSELTVCRTPFVHF